MEPKRIVLTTNIQVALNAILEVDLLCNIAKLSRWNLLFAPSFGILEEFIAKHADQVPIVILEKKMMRILLISTISEYTKDIDLNVFNTVC